MATTLSPSLDIAPAGPVRIAPAARVQGSWAIRNGLLVAVIAALAAGFLATRPEAAHAAIARAGPDLTRLLRAMAAMKMVFAAGVVAATWWRLGSAVTPTRLAVYGLACAAMAAGPGLIWQMASVKLGALLLHGGLLADILLLWRDPEMAARLGLAVQARRARLRVG